MKIKQIVDILGAKVVCGEDKLGELIVRGFASDLMSDVLTLDTDKMALVTGLSNLQTIRTAEMADISCIVFVRDKKVSREMLQIAHENEMVIIECKYSMFKTIGKLYESGLEPVY